MVAVLGVILWEIYFCLPLFIIAQKSEHEYAWAAFIPLANFWLMCDMADVSPLWLLVVLIPFLNAAAFPLLYILIWWRIAENTNKSGFWGVLMLVPVVSIFVAYYLAFTEPRLLR